MKYSLGLDIGVTSIGWAVIDEDKQRIHDIGVRIFERAEHPKNGESLAKPRRDARGARRRVKRRRQRLNAMKRFFISHSLLTGEEIDGLLATPKDPYVFRSKGLDEKLTNAELFIALYHIAKRRGYKSNRKSQEARDTEGSKVLSAISANEVLLASRGYRTAGEALVNDDAYQVHKRNKRDDYTNSFARDDFLTEFRAIIGTQRKLGLQLSDEDVDTLIEAREMVSLSDGKQIEMYYGSFAQRPFMNRELMEKMIGKCSLEPAEPRAPRASYSFELFRLAQDLVNVVLDTKGERRSLTTDEIRAVMDTAHKTRGIKYKTIRKVLNLPDETTFVYMRGKVNDKDPEGNAFGEMKFYHDIKKALGGFPEWRQFIDDPYALDAIGLVLTIEKTDEDMRRELRNLDLVTPLSDEFIAALLPLSYNKFAHFSIKAIRKLVPFIFDGQTHDKALISAGYEFNHPNRSNNTKLPPLSMIDAERITNPVVKRAISQVIKVINAVVQKHGLPYQIKIETTRELAKSFEERRKIKKRQDDNQATNQKIVDLIQEHGITNPTGLQITKYKLYKQQNGQCLYSGAPISSIERLFADDAAYEIDHIVPWSRSGDDGLGNKALVTREENQHKGNAIPFEAFGGDSEKWAAFQARIASLNLGRYKSSRCLAEKAPDKDWSAHALKDTQYITRFLKEYVEKNLAFSDPNKKQRVITPAGNITSYLRKRWGIGKSREDNVLHHAQDAALVAVVSQGIIQRVAAYNKYGEIIKFHRNVNQQRRLDVVTDYQTGEILDDTSLRELRGQAFDHVASTDHHFPRPWDRFDDEVRRRTADMPTDQLQNELRGFDNYDDEFRLTVRPIFVSRMPNRKASGRVHQETLRSAKADENNMRTVRMPLASIKLKDLALSPVKDSDPQLYTILNRRLGTFDDKPDKAFAEPVFKKDKNGNDTHQVRSIKVASKQPSGFYVNAGKAFVNNGSMVRLDVYKKEKEKSKGKMEHFFVPAYTHQVGKNRPTPTKILPAPKGFTDVDDTFTKVATLFPNDYVRCRFEDRIEEGYYVKYNISSGVMTLIKHSAPGKDKDAINEISARSAVSIERYDISVLGDNAPRI